MSPAQALATNKLQACGGSLSVALFYPPQGGEPGRSKAQYPDDLYRFHVGRAAGAARAVGYFAPDPAGSGHLHRALFPADAEARRKTVSVVARPAVALIAGAASVFTTVSSARGQARFTRWRCDAKLVEHRQVDPSVPECSTRPRTSAACCCLSLAARSSGQPVCDDGRAVPGRARRLSAWY